MFDALRADDHETLAAPGDDNSANSLAVFIFAGIAITAPVIGIGFIAPVVMNAIAPSFNRFSFAPVTESALISDPFFSGAVSALACVILLALGFQLLDLNLLCACARMSTWCKI